MLHRASAALFFSILLGLFFVTTSFASTGNGTIDPRNKGYSLVRFLDPPDVGILGSDSRINFGKFTTERDSRVRITDDGITGFLWGASAGWIVTNCEQTANSCEENNAEFHIAVADDGTLSGFAWGENTGWINFGPFTLNTVPQVQIQRDGFFRGTNESDVGYAWSENFGWIIFDCSTETNCLYTDYRASDYRPPIAGPITECRDGLDNDGNGFFDMEDEDCGNGNFNETPPGVPPIIPGVIEPVLPTLPTKPQTPTTPGTPFIPSTPEESEGPGTLFPDIIDTVTDTVTDIFTGEVSLPEARDRVIELFLLIIAWFKEFFARLAEALLRLMQDPRARDTLLQVVVFGLGIIALLAVLLAVFVPVVSFVQLTLFPRLLWQNILVFLGISNAATPWGIVYNTATGQPLALTEITIINSDNVIVASAITASDGTFAADVPDGMYRVGIGTHNTMVAAAGTIPLIYNTSYTSGTTVQITNGQPIEPFDIAVQGVSVVAPEITPFKEFLLYHEVSFTNISFVLFGAGLLASVLYTIFFPSIFALGMTIAYVVIAIFRSIGICGSYSSVVLSKTQEQPITGALVTVFDKYTHVAVAKALTSRFGRVYLNLPEGYFYTTITAGENTPRGPFSVFGRPFATRAGLFRKRFTI